MSTLKDNEGFAIRPNRSGEKTLTAAETSGVNAGAAMAWRQVNVTRTVQTTPQVLDTYNAITYQTPLVKPDLVSSSMTVTEDGLYNIESSIVHTTAGFLVTFALRIDGVSLNGTFNEFGGTQFINYPTCVAWSDQAQLQAGQVIDTTYGSILSFAMRIYNCFIKVTRIG
jgi:hypothetical protein